MRSTMLALIGVTAMAACGSTPTTQTDGMVSKDMTVTDPPDMKKAKYKPNCGVVQSDPQNLLASATPATQALYQAVQTCRANTCGLPGVTDGGWNGKACATEVDGGASADCDICAGNTLVNSKVNFTDSTTMMDIVCLPNTSAATCMACDAQWVACFDDPCTDTKDCPFTFGPSKTPAICDLEAGSSTFGTCQPQP